MKNRKLLSVLVVLALCLSMGTGGVSAAAQTGGLKTEAAQKKGEVSPYALEGLQDMPSCEFLDLFCSFHFIAEIDEYTEDSVGKMTIAADGVNSYNETESIRSWFVDGKTTTVFESSKTYTVAEMDKAELEEGKKMLESALKTGSPVLSDREYQGKGKDVIPFYSEKGDKAKYTYYEYLTDISDGSYEGEQTERFYMKDGDVFAIYSHAVVEDLIDTETTQVVKSISGTIPKDTFTVPDLKGYEKFDMPQTSSADDKKDDSSGNDAEAMVREADSWYFGTNKKGYDPEKAEELYLKAAKAGDGEGWYGLGRLYEEKMLLAEENHYQTAMEYYDKAVKEGCALGYYGKGCLYQDGHGVDQDYKKAEEFFRKAADGKCLEGYLGLGELYEDGNAQDADGPDGEKALEYYKKAAGSDSFQCRARAYTMLGNMYKSGAGSLKKDAEKALEYYEKAEKENYHPAIFNLGRMYYNGQDVDQDYEKALSYCERAAELGSGAAENLIGLMYSDGKGVKQDDKEAFRHFERSAENGDKTGLSNAANCYLEGRGVKQDYDKALEYFTIAAGEKDGYSCGKLGSMYADGEGVEQDFAKARSWYEKGAELGNISSMNNLGWIYMNGNGVDTDYKTALSWFARTLAKDQENEYAIKLIGEMLEKGWVTQAEVDEALKNAG